MSFEADQNSQPFTEADEKHLCVSCMFPNETFAHFCAKCDTPLSSYASTAPFERIFAEGHVYREATERPRNLIVVLGIWLIFGMMALSGVVFVVFGRCSGFLCVAVGAFLLVISLMVIWKTTWNYLAKGKEVKNDG